MWSASEFYGRTGACEKQKTRLLLLLSFASTDAKDITVDSEFRRAKLISQITFNVVGFDYRVIVIVDLICRYCIYWYVER